METDNKREKQSLKEIRIGKGCPKTQTGEKWNPELEIDIKPMDPE